MPQIIKILAIDDEVSMLKTLHKALKNKGYELETYNDAEEGLKALIQRDDIELALLDVKMPKKNGFEIYTEMRKHRCVPVLFVTAYPKSFNARNDEVVDMWRKGFADGTTDIIYKPFDLKTLYEKVESLIGRSKAAPPA